MTQIIYNLAVKESSYIDQQGQTKNRYLNVGSIVQKKDGGKFILLKRSFNPAGIANPDNQANIVVSLFKPKHNNQPMPQAQVPPVPSIEAINNDNLDDLPF